ncbi:PpiC-type peptidyl-prolyl cis-trans isomerase [Thioalkalivibrio nitratireducens DSM 14787]|uniref:peptidylprolyl isomerase n=1 Tax=Thioalkalivibrio nitratireducens (strain DSM 14787 / UNIQEM 213 / ALEN2) TaxID=1255043 RepID=L0DVP8_THIND|nr:peptidylprolyl isomerase [Thioalkalivibrio nitratireducens]AGA33092.1 PpiC-type peptidyl-prolyl cis-trans isomerase [Thioalkalivibrio nitratireducens DSM 14787]
MSPVLAPAAAALLLLTLNACERAEPPPESTTLDTDTVAIVNDTPITRATVFAYAGLDANTDMPGMENVLDEVINLELLRQQAVAQGIDQESDVRMLLQSIKTNLLASQVIERHVESIEFSESEIQAEYDQQVAAMDRTGYRTSHILVESEDEAAELIAQLQDGADFAELALEHSIDASSERGGDLGWFTPREMIPPFAQAVAALEPGHDTQEPVQTRFGWHVIRLHEMREIAPPSLDEVRPEIEDILEGRALRTYMDELRAAARIEFAERPAQ